MPKTPTPPTALCFDLDDTLIDDAAASSAGLRAVMERIGHPDFGAARALWDIQTEISFGSYLRGRIGLEEQRRERVRALAVQSGHDNLADQHCDELYRIYLEAHRAAWQVYPDTHATLAALGRAGYRMALLTNGVESLQHAKLQALELTGYFHTVVCADTAGAGKPDPRIFHFTAQRLGVETSACWHVGDQIQSDGVGASASRMHPVIIDRTGRAPFEGITTIPDLESLPRMLGLTAPTGAI
ncbi:HAD family hydrolase [Nocardiopsis sp. MG754419]|uniref:HAD family hydrolase n=1 Tax=Nocardiopsis sp. MG754419 TaxID=2259865 RepID=UPI001BA61E00|nr:HAD family hydrolase [Nocardiopsis sp. MG754419]MBR8743079.1 HAD family hydrolase [Nocardiopsis sp. MG754419]